MPSFDSIAPPLAESEDPSQAARNARYGLRLFFAYCVLYGAYVLTNAFAPTLMENTVGGGVNWAIFSGLGLIAAAFGMALWYGWLCRGARAGAANSEAP